MQPRQMRDTFNPVFPRDTYSINVSFLDELFVAAEPRCNRMIFWITHILAFGFLLLEIFLLAVRRCRDPKQPSDRGTLRPVWILIGSGCLVGFLLAPKVSFLSWPDSLAIVLLADLLMIIGMVLRIWSIVHLGKFFTVNVAIQEGQRVIQDGPYRFVRHPSYSGSILAIVGLACLTFNWLG